MNYRLLLSPRRGRRCYTDHRTVSDTRPSITEAFACLLLRHIELPNITFQLLWLELYEKHRELSMAVKNYDLQECT